MGLILHCGAEEVQYQQLKEYDVTPRNHSWVNKKSGQVHSLTRSERWAGIQHYHFAESVVNTCAGLDMPINMAESKWGVSEEGSDLFALLKFHHSHPDGRPTLPAKYVGNGVVPNLGLRHSNRGRFSAQGTIGGSVTVCDNLMITGNFVFKHKHTTGNVSRLGESVVEGMLKYMTGMAMVQDTVKKMQKTYLNDFQVGRIYRDLGRKKILPWSHIGQVDKYWINPTHSEFEDPNQWRMYNAINTVAKQYNPNRQMEVVGKATSLLTEWHNTTTQEAIA